MPPLQPGLKIGALGKPPAMTLALRRTVFAEAERRADDYEVRYDGRSIGRILRLRMVADQRKILAHHNKTGWAAFA